MIVLAKRNSPIPYTAASSLFKESLDKLRAKSSTARGIVDFVEKDKTQVQLLVTDVDGAFGPKNNEYGFDGPCIVWNPGGHFKTNGAEITGSFPSGAPKFDKKLAVTYPPEITLLHELGHAKQFIEGGWFGPDGPLKDVAEVEADNLKRHENPVCKDYGLLQRVKYTDFVGFIHVPVETARAVGR